MQREGEMREVRKYHENEKRGKSKGDKEKITNRRR